MVRQNHLYYDDQSEEVIIISGSLIVGFALFTYQSNIISSMQINFSYF
jgi:hypothetical protein